MPLCYLDHVNVRTAALERQIEFYENVLGLRRGERPPFSFGGAWLYCGDRPVVHLVSVAETPSPTGALRLEHFAFRGEGIQEFVARLRALRVPYSVGTLVGFGYRQVDFADPDGNRIHVDFPPDEPLPTEPA